VYQCAAAAQVALLRTDFAKRTAEAESLRARVEKAESTVGVARDLLGKLAGEKHRWGAQVGVGAWVLRPRRMQRQARRVQAQMVKGNEELRLCGGGVGRACGQPGG